MMRNYLFNVVLAVTMLGVLPVMAAYAAGDESLAHDTGEADNGEIPKGSHGGKLFEQDGFAIELVIHETGVPPEFHIYATQQGKPLDPDAVEASVELIRVDGQVDRFSFSPLQDFLRGKGVVSEPHSFDVVIHARHAGTTYRWDFSTYEGRTEIPDQLARDAGIETEIAGSVTIEESVALTGRIKADPARMAKVRARFPGVVRSIETHLGERVRAGAVLARIESNESLRTYGVQAPIDGMILQRDIQAGMTTGDEPLFLIADLTQVWVELDVFARHTHLIRAGQAVTIETLDGSPLHGRIDWVSPLALHASQSVQARVILDNAEGLLRPGQFVRGRVTVAEHPVGLAVRQSAIQRFRDFQVVFARFGETYEVRMLELGRQNSEWAEVLGGLEPGSEYVTGNSYLIKADIEKSGASHDH